MFLNFFFPQLHTSVKLIYRSQRIYFLKKLTEKIIKRMINKQYRWGNTSFVSIKNSSKCLCKLYKRYRACCQWKSFMPNEWFKELQAKLKIAERESKAPEEEYTKIQLDITKTIEDSKETKGTLLPWLHILPTPLRWSRFQKSVLKRKLQREIVRRKKKIKRRRLSSSLEN